MNGAYNHSKRVTQAILMGVLLQCSSAQAGSPAQPAPKVSIAIQAQPLGKALNDWASQTGYQVLLSSRDDTGGKMALALFGSYTPEAALQQLLANSGLKYEFVAERTVTIRAGKAEATSMVAPADQMRLAGAEPGHAEQKSADSQEKEAGHQMTVHDQRVEPFVDGNADIPRTTNDAQPYYIFDSETLERSGAASIEDFLKQRLTMNAVALSNGQVADGNFPLGNTSTINLRGLGADKTLILVNGRRIAGVNTAEATDRQPDLNGIPLDAIDRIEVLPSSSSGIYGGSAIGGVVNVILKKEYTGGQLRAVYDNTWDMRSPRRMVSGSYGLSLEGGKTHLNIGASWSDAGSLLLQDRVAIFRRNLADIEGRVPGFILSGGSLWLGVLPNIVSFYGEGEETLVLKNNGNPVDLGSRATYIPAGASAATPMVDLSAQLLANAGKWNLAFPRSTQGPTGLLRPFGSAPQTRSLKVSARRQMSPRLELFMDVSASDTRSISISNPFDGRLSVNEDAVTNPFTTIVSVLVPDAGRVPLLARSQNRGLTMGALARLPGGWTGAADYSWSESDFDSLLYQLDTPARDADLLSGELNPFVDTLSHPLNIGKYLQSFAYDGSNRLHDLSVRGSGPLPSLPWGTPVLAIGLEYRLARTPQRTGRMDFPVTVSNNRLFKYYARDAATGSGYMEATLPLIETGRWPMAHALDLQLSARSERYAVDAGTFGEAFYYNRIPPLTAYFGDTLDSQPYFSRDSYTSRNYTLGVKYQPVEELTLRVSRATAFLPPAPDQLISSPPRVAAFYERITDPVTGETLSGGYQIISGGNPDLAPQNSKSLNAGVIWQPSARLRLNAEYYRIEQFDAITSISEQQAVDEESSHPERVTRGSDGRIVMVEATMINLYHRETSGLDFSASYTAETAAGNFSLQAMGSVVLNLKDQYSQARPEYEAAGFHPAEGGATKYKANVTLSWEWRQWMIDWTARYISSYKTYGADGGPLSQQIGGGTFLDYVAQQGGSTIPRQVYHDLLVSHDFGRRAGGTPQSALSAASLLNGVSLQLGVHNVFDKAPPLDVYYSGNYYFSPYGDTKLRTYWVSLQKNFQ